MCIQFARTGHWSRMLDDPTQILSFRQYSVADPDLEQKGGWGVGGGGGGGGYDLLALLAFLPSVISFLNFLPKIRGGPPQPPRAPLYSWTRY